MDYNVLGECQMRPKIRLVEMWKRGRLGEKQMVLKEYDVVKKVERLTYSQDWKSYDAAKTREKVIAMDLLLELESFLEEKENRTPGRPSFTLKEQLVCMFIYCYSRFSSRRSIPDIEFAKRRNLLSRTPHFTSVMNMFRKPRMTRVLSDLVEITSLPLKMFEEHFSIDSSGFSTSYFE